CVASDLALNQGFLETPDAGELANTGHTAHRTLLHRVYGDVARIDAAAEQPWKLEVRYKMESADQPIAVECAFPAAACDPYALYTAAAFGSRYPRIAPVARTQCPQPVTCSLQKFAGLCKEHVSAEAR